MISMLRLDERMIHGQVAIKWTRHMNIDRVIVVSEAAANNDFIKRSIIMAAPPTTKAAVKTVQDAIPMINDPRMEEHNLMLISTTLEDLLTLVESVPNIQLINIGNYGRIASKKEGVQRKTYQINLYLYPEEAEILKKVLSYGIKCVYQTVPEDAPVDMKRVLG